MNNRTTTIKQPVMKKVLIIGPAVFQGLVDKTLAEAGVEAQSTRELEVEKIKRLLELNDYDAIILTDILKPGHTYSDFLVGTVMVEREKKRVIILRHDNESEGLPPYKTDEPVFASVTSATPEEEDDSFRAKLLKLVKPSRG